MRVSFPDCLDHQLTSATIVSRANALIRQICVGIEKKWGSRQTDLSCCPSFYEEVREKTTQTSSEPAKSYDLAGSSIVLPLGRVYTDEVCDLDRTFAGLLPLCWLICRETNECRATDYVPDLTCKFGSNATALRVRSRAPCRWLRGLSGGVYGQFTGFR